MKKNPYPMNSREWWEQYFVDTWDADGGGDQTRYSMRRLLDEIPGPEAAFLRSRPLTILDWGCAFGEGVELLGQAFPNCRVVGLDFASRAIDQASGRHPGREFILAGNGEIPSEFDVIITSNCLEHFAQPLEVVRTHLRSCKKLYIAMVPYNEYPLHEQHRSQFKDESFPKHIGRFTRIYAKTIDMDSAHWNGQQLLVVYGSQSYLSERPHFEHQDSEQEKWDSYYASLPLFEADEAALSFNAELVERISELLSPGSRVLEAGCGGGWQSLALARSGKFQVSLMDSSRQALGYARRLFEREQVSAEFILGDVFIPGEPYFDFVFNAGVLEHYTLDEQAAFLRGMATRSRNYVLALVPNRLCYWYWLWRIQVSAKGDWPYGKEVPLIDLSAAFETAGLRFLGQTFMGRAWTEIFINNLSSMDQSLRNEILEINRSPLIPEQQSSYLLASLGTVSSETLDVPGIWEASRVPEENRKAEAGAALADALALRIGGEQKLRKLEAELLERDRTIQEVSTQAAASEQRATESEQQTIEKERALQAIERQISEQRNAIESLKTQIAENEQARLTREAELATVLESLTFRLEETQSARDALAAKTVEQERVTTIQNEQLIDKERRISSLSSQLANKEGEIQKIRGTLGWRLLNAYGPIKYRYLLPVYRRLGLPPFGRNPETKKQDKHSRISSGSASNSTTLASTTSVILDEQGSKAVDSQKLERILDAIFQERSTYDVVCFPIIDWDFRFQRPQQLMSRFASSGHRVFYLSQTFRPSGEPYTINEKYHNVFEVSLCGLPRNVYTEALDDRARNSIFSSLDAVRRDFSLSATVAFAQLPFWWPLVDKSRAEFAWPIVYDCMDHHAGFSTNNKIMTEQERDLLRFADLVVVSSSFLENEAKRYSSETLLLRNGCDYEHFAKVSSKKSGRPVIGYYGAIADWFDSDLVADLAERRPDWEFVLVGSTVSGNTRRLSKLPNVFLPGEKHYSEIPDWLGTFDVAIIPFKRLPLTEATNPVKAYEILASGKPLVSVPIPEMTSLVPLIRLASTAEEFERQIEESLKPEQSEMVERRRAFAKGNTWEKRFEVLSAAVPATFSQASIIIVTFNNLDLNRLCLESLYARTEWPNFEVIVVDNASTDGTPEYLLAAEKSFPNLRVILNDKNLGFAAANNIGLRQATGDYLVLLNNDTVPTRGWLSALIRHLHADTRIGLIGPVTNAIANEAKVDVGYGQLDDLHTWAASFIRDNDGQLFPIPMLAMFCVAMRREVFERVGLLDERFEVGMFEDDDYCRRVRACGYELRCARDSFVHHWQLASFRLLGEDNYHRVYEENKLKYERKWNRRQPAPNNQIALYRRQLQEVLAKVERRKGVIIFLPSIGWNINLFQRPHHLAREFARRGYISIFDSSNSEDDVKGFKEIKPNLFLYHGPQDVLHEIPAPILWAFPYNFDLKDSYSKTARTVYDWIDDLEVFPYDRAFLEANHNRALKEATLVTTVARTLHDRASALRTDAVYLPNGVEYERFAAQAEVPKDVGALTREGKPIAGYYGALADWFDYGLLDEVAAMRTDWNFLLIGQMLDQSLSHQPILNRTNVKWIGPREYESLPGYLRLFDVAMIPFVINNITQATSPLKLYEYLASGKAVVTTAMPECESFSEVRIVGSAREFSEALDRALEQGRDEGYRARVRALARENSWAVRGTAIENLLTREPNADETSAHHKPLPSAPQKLVGAAANIAERFRHFRHGRNERFFEALCNYFSDIESNTCLPMYFEFAITCNERGRRVAGLLQKYTDLWGKRYLDVGCAYAGFPVAFAEKGAEVIGIDSDEALLELARYNLLDNDIDAPLLKRDATRFDALVEFRNSFDIVTCNDVIEHVDEPQLLLRNVAELLRDNGIAYFEIPNRYHPRHVLQDGHYQLFGITLLDYPEARQYYSLHSPGVPYSVRHYLELGHYKELFADAGLTLIVMDENFEGLDMQMILDDIVKLRVCCDAELNKVPSAMRNSVQEHLRAYLSEIDSSIIVNPQERNSMLRYGVSFWRLLGRKSK